MIISLNDEVKVKLKIKGVDILETRHHNLRVKIISNGGKDIGSYSLPLDEDGYYTTQLWVLLNIFHTEFNWNGFDVFQNNELIFKD